MFDRTRCQSCHVLDVDEVTLCIVAAVDAHVLIIGDLVDQRIQERLMLAIGGAGAIELRRPDDGQGNARLVAIQLRQFVGMALGQCIRAVEG